MILLLGGTGDTAPIASGLADEGYMVLVSMATDIQLEIGRHPNISRRAGRLDEDGMTSLIREQGIKALVDATHPYAEAVRKTARRLSERLNIPYFAIKRRSGIEEGEDIILAPNHEEAASIACALGRTVFLTTGVKNLKPYVIEAKRTGVRLIVRILPVKSSIDSCRAAGIDDEFIIAGRGPFAVDENRSVIKRFGAGVVVTKDSGPGGGTPEKLEAARLEGCRVVVVKRPEEPAHNSFDTYADLISTVMAKVSR
ncbi:MAG TPA: precorrin-6A reductase [Syntrophales bacterium]|nr:precorrin-6A reductase [Syntrophales bacterium]